MRRPYAVALPRARGPGQHGRRERDAQRGAQRAQHRLGLFQQVPCVDHRAAEPLEDLRLLPEAEIIQGRCVPHARVGGQQLPGVPDQERVPQRRERLPVHLRQQVMGHVLGVGHGPARREGLRRQLADHRLPAGRLAGDDLFPARVRDPGAVQVEGVQRLVRDHGVRAVLPGPHQRGGHRPRPGPHGDPGRLTHHGPLRRLTGRTGRTRRRSWCPPRARCARRSPAAGPSAGPGWT